MKPMLMWNHNRHDRRGKLIQMIQVISSVVLHYYQSPGGRGLLAGILPQVWPGVQGF